MPQGLGSHPDRPGADRIAAYTYPTHSRAVAARRSCATNAGAKATIATRTQSNGSSGEAWKAVARAGTDGMRTWMPTTSRQAASRKPLAGRRQTGTVRLRFVEGRAG